MDLKPLATIKRLETEMRTAEAALSALETRKAAAVEAYNKKIKAKRREIGNLEQALELARRLQTINVVLPQNVLEIRQELVQNLALLRKMESGELPLKDKPQVVAEISRLQTELQAICPHTFILCTGRHNEDSYNHHWCLVCELDETPDSDLNPLSGCTLMYFYSKLIETRKRVVLNSRPGAGGMWAPLEELRTAALTLPFVLSQ